MSVVVSVEDLEQRIGSKVVLDRVSFEVSEGECFGVFGPKGCGKSTLLHILAGIDRFKKGKVRICDLDIGKTEKYRASLGLVTQRPSLFRDLRVGENLDFIAALKDVGRENVLAVVDRFCLEDFLDKPLTALYAGEFQRLSMACAMLNDPKVLILDEPISRLDLESSRVILREIKDFLSGGGACVWAFSGGVGLFQHMDRVAWLEGGGITIYSPQEAGREWDRQVEALSLESGVGDV
ncbi:MAG: ABC transporter ATP-binding protein [Clostridia bacterium]|nr:ABC transporter ATP-binding protein [Clostridia bacterium]